MSVAIHELHDDLVVEPETLLFHFPLLLHESGFIGQGNLNLLVSVDLRYELFPVSAADRAVGHDFNLRRLLVALVAHEVPTGGSDRLDAQLVANRALLIVKSYPLDGGNMRNRAPDIIFWTVIFGLEAITGMSVLRYLRYGVNYLSTCGSHRTKLFSRPALCHRFRYELIQRSIVSRRWSQRRYVPLRQLTLIRLLLVRSRLCFDR